MWVEYHAWDSESPAFSTRKSPPSMSQSTTLNRRIVLSARPRGAPTATDFRLESVPVPTPEAGQLLLRTLFLSLDPYMRGRMSDGPSYAAPVAIGDLMVGGTVSRVEASQHGDFKVGDLAVSYTHLDVYKRQGQGGQDKRQGQERAEHAR